MLLELFAGSRSIGKVAEEKGLKVFSNDIVHYKNIDLVKNILEVEPKDIPFIPSFIWASIPCQTFSVASISTHWNKDHSPKTWAAIESIKLVQQTLDIIEYYYKLNPDLIWYIENPRGKLRRIIPNLQQLDRVTIWYCKYNDKFKRAKPTDLFSNNFYNLFNTNGWKPRPECFNNNKNCEHEKCPRGDKSQGTQGQSNAYYRSQLPRELCESIIDNFIKYKLNEKDIS